MSLRARVDDFCKTATGLGKKIETLEFEIKTLKEKLNAAKTVKAKPTSAPKKTRKVKSVKAVPVPVPVAEPMKTTRRKMTDEEKAQRKREREVAKELKKREEMGLPPVM
jgi:vacuolar-type H+-ATPase subunit I/STV1